jgi:hypothetical protein
MKIKLFSLVVLGITACLMARGAAQSHVVDPVRPPVFTPITVPIAPIFEPPTVLVTPPPLETPSISEGHHHPDETPTPTPIH